MAPPRASNAYRDELRAAQDRIAQLEEDLAARQEDDGLATFDQRIAELEQLRRGAVRSAKPRAQHTRALLAGLVGAMAMSVPLMTMTWAMPHPNYARLAILAVGAGVVLAAMVLFLGHWGSKQTIAALDGQIAEAKRRRAEQRRMIALEDELRAAREAGGKRARIDVEPEEESAEEEVIGARRARR